MTSTTLLEKNPTAKSKPAPKLNHSAGKRWKYLALFALVVAAVIGWRMWQTAHTVNDGASGLITETVKRGDLIETVSATGSVTAQTGAQVKIGSQITGRIKKLNADVGSQVKAGQIIAELDLPDVQAQLDQAKANLAGAKTKQAQQASGVGMQQTQINSAILQAEAGRNSALARLRSAQAASNLQSAQTPTDIQRAENGVAGAKAALLTGQSALAQTQAGADLQVANAQQQVNQAQATAANSDINLKRMQNLLEKGFIAASVVDQAQATATVNKSLILGAQQSLALVKQKITADLDAGRNLMTQSEQNVKTAQSALVAAKAGTFMDAVKRADVGDARALVSQSEANLTLARGNTAQNVLKQQDVQQAQAAVHAVEEQVRFAQAQMNKTFIRSPITGTVLQLAAQQGETLAAGLSSPTLIVVADLNRLQVDTYVDETDIGKVKIGQLASVTVDAFPRKQFAGRVTKIASGSTIQQGVITYDVTVALDGHERQLKPDMTASVTIETGKRTGVLLVPSEAVKVGVNGGTVNVLITKDGKSSTESRKVKTGGTDGTNTEIREGLKESEIVVLAGIVKAAAATKSASPFAGGARGGRGGGGGGGGGR